MSKTLLIIHGVTVVVAGSAFYSGMKYGQANMASGLQQRMTGGGFGNGRTGNRSGGNNTVAGDIIAKDATSITVKLRDGGSKIVFYAGSTDIGKSVPGTSDDLAIGKTVMANSTPNQDGSVTAQSIQIRPAHPTDQNKGN